MLAPLNLKRPIAFFDLETTGINVVRDRIIEISILKVTPQGDFISKTKRVNPTIPIPKESSDVHGISDADVKDAPTFKAIAKSVADFLVDCDLSGFNMVKFDLPLLLEEFARCGIDFDFKSRSLIDSQKIFFMMEQRNLSAAYEFYVGQPIETLGAAHSAEVDTMACYHVLCKQIEKYAGKSAKGREIEGIKNDMKHLHTMLGEDRADLAGHFNRKNDGKICFNFGKFRGQEIKEVFAKEPNYYSWIMQAEFPMETKKYLTNYRLQESLTK